MKKNNIYLADNEINLGDFIKALCREKILILFISIIGGLACYLYASLKTFEIKTEVKIKNPPFQIFEPYGPIYSDKLSHSYDHKLSSTNPNHNHNSIHATYEQFVINYKLYFLSFDNLLSFFEESRDFDNFKAYLKSRNIDVKHYFHNRIIEAKDKNLIIQNEYIFFFTKELEGNIFLNKYAQFVKEKTILDTKKNLESSILNKLMLLDNALETAKAINLENPILKSMSSSNQVVNEPEDLFYKGTKVLSQESMHLQKLLIKLKNDKFNYNHLLKDPLNSKATEVSKLKYFIVGLMLGLFLSVVIIFFKFVLRNN